MKKRLFVSLAIVMFLIGTVCSANALTFYDNFEAQSFDPFWTVLHQNYGTVVLSSDQAYSGTQSAKFSSINGGQRDIWLNHEFSDVIKGDVSVRFYDATPGQANLYSTLTMYNSTVNYPDSGSLFSIGVMDWDGKYYYYHSPDGTSVRTSVTRTLGWHEFKISIDDTGGQMFIDDVLVEAFIGDYGVDSVNLTLSGPYWRPNSTCYYDDFSITTTSVPTPEPCTMLLLGTGLIGMAGVIRKKTVK